MTSPPSEAPDTLTVKQLAKRWGMTPNAIRILRHRGKAPRGFKRGHSRNAPVLFRYADVLAFEEQQLAEDIPSRRGSTPEHRPAEPLLVPRQRHVKA